MRLLEPGGLVKHYRYLSPDAFSTLPSLLQGWREGADQCGIFALLPEREIERIPEIQAACRQAALPLVGSVFPGLITDQGMTDRGALFLCFDSMPAWFLVESAGKPEGTVVAELEAEISRLRPAGLLADARPNLFLVFDALIPNVATMLVDLYEKIGNSVSYSGANAGSEAFLPIACLFDGSRSVSMGILGLLLPPETSLFAKHEYVASEGSLQATTTKGNRISKIDGRPAIEAYRELIRSEYGVLVDADNFYQYAVHFPLGVVTAFDILVRIPVALNDDGSIHCVAEIPEHTVLRVLRAPDLEESRCVEALDAAVRGGSASREDFPLLVFYCAGRRLHFGDQGTQAELLELRRRLGAAGMAGALSLGEIMSEDDELRMPRFHNAAIICIR